MNDTGIQFEGSDYLQGKFLIAMPGMGDARFEKAVIYICAHSEKGAMGFMINRALTTPTIDEFFTQLNIVEGKEIENLKDNYTGIQLFSGGPVEPGRGFVLHSSEYKGESTLPVDDTICLTATLEILRAIVTGNGPEKILLALGYSGWASGQLEEEIISNGWLISSAEADVVFGSNNAVKYDEALKILGVDSFFLSADAGHA